MKEGDLKSEYLLPNIVDKLLKEKRANVKVLETQDRWFGVTYKEDKETVLNNSFLYIPQFHHDPNENILVYPCLSYFY